jgi:hypothetical protein
MQFQQIFTKAVRVGDQVDFVLDAHGSIFFTDFNKTVVLQPLDDASGAGGLGEKNIAVAFEGLQFMAVVTDYYRARLAAQHLPIIA